MKVHVEFSTYNMLNIKGTCTANFYYANGTAIKDLNNSFQNADGNVSVEVVFTPGYRDAKYNDLELFIPYSELHVTNPGRTDLSVRIFLTAHPFSLPPKQLTSSKGTSFWYEN